MRSSIPETTCVQQYMGEHSMLAPSAAGAHAVTPAMHTWQMRASARSLPPVLDTVVICVAALSSCPHISDHKRSPSVIDPKVLMFCIEAQYLGKLENLDSHVILCHSSMEET